MSGAVRMVFEHQDEHPLHWAAITSIAHKFGVSTETLRKWVRQVEVAEGHRPGLMTDERDRLKALEREICELRRANEILRARPNGSKPDPAVGRSTRADAPRRHHVHAGDHAGRGATMDDQTAFRAPLEPLSEAVAGRADDAPVSGARPSLAVPQAVERDQVGRGVGIVLLLSIALIHLLDGVGTFHDTRYLFWLYTLLMAGTLVVSVVLLRTDSRLAWSLVALMAGLTLLGFVLSRTTGLPSATDDIGNWTDPLGLASIFVEGIAFLLGAYKVATTPRLRRTA